MKKIFTLITSIIVVNTLFGQVYNEVIYQNPVDPTTRVLNTNLPVGSSLASSNVGLDGSANFSLPIFVSPGTAGIQPQISIDYNSNSGNGILGMGWNIGGLSAISRLPQDFYHDGQIKEVTLTSSDRFGFNGNRLIVTNGGTYGANNTVYHTQSENFTQITSLGASGSGPRWFKVETKEGLTIEFGNSSNSVIQAQSTDEIIYWYISKIIDKKGNYMTFTYHSDREKGELWPERIDYTANDNAGLVAYNSINFIYGNRKKDIITSYIAGSSLIQNKLLTSIEVKNGNSIIRKYEFKYTFTDKSRLNEFVEYGSLGHQFNSHVFSYYNYTDASEMFLSTPFTTSFPVYSNDFNGDGRDEVLFNHQMYKFWIDHFSVAPGVSVPSGKIISGDFNGDGKAEILVILTNSTNGFTLYNFDGNTFVSQGNYGVGSTGTPDLYAQDVNGDGICDVLNRNPANGTITITWGSSSSPLSETFNASIGWGSKQYWGDFNGNGKMELMTLDASGYKIYEWNNNAFNIRTSGAQPTNTNTAYVGDFNNDGKSDFLWGIIKRVPLNYRKFSSIKSNISNGPSFITTSFGADLSDHVTGGDLLDFNVFDFDGDGDDEFYAYEPDVHYYLTFKYNNGIFTSVQGDDVIDGPILLIKDFNGDQIPDPLHYRIIDNNVKCVLIRNGNQKDLLSTVANGLNSKVQFVYKPTTDASVYSNTNTYSYPLGFLVKPLYLVSTLKTDNDPFSQNEVNYKYTGGVSYRVDNSFLGFTGRTVSNPVTKVSTSASYSVNSSFLLLSPATESTYINSKIVDQKYFTPDIKDYGNKRFFSYIKETTSHSYDLNTSVLYNSVVSGITYDDCGNVTQATSNFKNSTETHQIDNIYKNYGSFCNNKLDKSTVTKQRGSETAFTSVTSYSYQIDGDLIQKIEEPGNAKQVITNYSYNDPYGNITSIMLSPDGIKGRTIDFTYDPKGRFLLKKKNAFGHYIDYEYNEGVGVLNLTRNNLLLTTRYFYDEFGRLTETVSPDNNSSKSTLNWGTSSNPQYTSFFVKNELPGSQLVYEYFDKFGRNIQTERTSLDGTKVLIDKKYNSLGQVDYVTLPYFVGSSTIDKEEFKYDLLNRLTSVKMPGIDKSYLYDGLTTTTTDNISLQTNVSILDGAGKLIKETDKGGDIIYNYFSSGLTRTIVTPSKTLEMNYDKFGRRTYFKDPDAGVYTYDNNIFGEVNTQTDPKLLTTTYNYDDIGRVNSILGGTFDITYTYKGNGQLDNILASNGIKYTYAYDDFGRATGVTEFINGSTFISSSTFNTLGQISQSSYPNNFIVDYIYQNGYLKEIQRNDTHAKIWELNTINSKDQLTQFTFGNQLSTQKTYDTRGHIKTIQTGANSSIQNLEYDFNFNGLMDCRKDNRRGLVENFGYDPLNRLNKIQIGTNPAKYLTYLPNGNIQEKYDIGIYSYNATQPSAVTQVSNTFNLIPQNEQNIAYTSFQKVSSISEGTNNSAFTYGPDFTRKYVDSNINGINIKKYYTNLYEQEIKGSITRELYYIIAYGEVVAIYEKGLDTPKMHYVHNDHLGSFNVFTNDGGTIEQELSFDAWGNRRDPSTLQNLASAPTGLITNRGFTGHEHMDAFNLINMNGRIYDPLLARFLSPDAFIQGNSTQNFNSYSYCINNPLSFTDPSGMIMARREIPVGLNANGHIIINFGGGGNGSLFPKMGVQGSPMTNLEYDIALANNYDEITGNHSNIDYIKNSLVNQGYMNSSDVKNYKYGPLGGGIWGSSSFVVRGLWPTNSWDLDHNNPSIITDWDEGGGWVVDDMVASGYSVLYLPISGNSRGKFSDNFFEMNGKIDKILDYTSVGAYGAVLGLDQDLKVKSRYQAPNFNPAVEAKVTKAMTVASKYMDYAGKAFGVVSVLDHGNKAYKNFAQGHIWKGIGYGSVAILDIGLMCVKTTNPFILVGIMAYNIADATML